jgi:hypothetical protein
MRRKGLSRPGAFKDDSYEIDWGKFLYVLKEKDMRALAEIPTLYGSRPPPNDSVWARIKDDGFDVKVFDRNIRNKEKGVDMEMGMDVAERIFGDRQARKIVIAAGDEDYVPAVQRAQGKDGKSRCGSGRTLPPSSRRQRTAFARSTRTSSSCALERASSREITEAPPPALPADQGTRVRAQVAGLRKSRRRGRTSLVTCARPSGRAR